MHPLLKKLQFKTQSALLLLFPPEELSELWQAWSDELTIQTEWQATQTYDFVLIFAMQGAQIQKWVQRLAGQLTDDALLWIAYPKKSSKRYASDINRDSAHWQAIGEIGYEAVRQVAINEDWSALRFRDARFIKKMTRDVKRAMSKEGKKKLED